MFSLLRYAVVLGAVYTAWVCAEGTVKMAWLTDPGDGRFGPDGPWQALFVGIGPNYSVSAPKHQPSPGSY